MFTYDYDTPESQEKSSLQQWFTRTGPTESFLRSAPNDVLLDNRETAPPAAPDPGIFTTVGPTPGFVYSR
jgi:hypothetical protein